MGGGGAERVLVNLVNNLDRTRFQVTVQTLFDTGVNRQYLSKDVTYIPGFPWQMPGNVRLFKLFSPEFLYRTIVKKKYDIVISYLEGPTARIVAGCPYPSHRLSWIHTLQYNSENAAYPFRSVSEAEEYQKRFQRVICVSTNVQQDYCSIYPFMSERSIVLYNTNETDEIREKGKTRVPDSIFGDGINIVTVGRLIVEKGYDRLVSAHRQLLDSGLKHNIYIVGEGKERQKIETLIAKNHVEDSFHLLGFHSNPYSYLAHGDLFICSSRREGFSTAVTEALILGIPVVSTNCSGAEELLGKNNEYGIVVENSVEGIYSGLKRMLENRELLQHYKKKAEERGNFFSKEKTVKAVEDMFDSLFEEE